MDCSNKNSESIKKNNFSHPTIMRDLEFGEPNYLNTWIGRIRTSHTSLHLVPSSSACDDLFKIRQNCDINGKISNNAKELKLK